MVAPLRVSAAEVQAFRERHKITGETLDRIMGLASKGRATRRWEADGAPYYVAILIAYADRFGLEKLKELACEGGVRKKTAGDAILRFRQRHGLSQEALDYLLGFSSQGRACRLWEAGQAPYYMTIVISCVDEYGLDIMRELGESRRQ